VIAAPIPLPQKVKSCDRLLVLLDRWASSLEETSSSMKWYWEKNGHLRYICETDGNFHCFYFKYQSLTKKIQIGKAFTPASSSFLATARLSHRNCHGPRAYSIIVSHLWAVVGLLSYYDVKDWWSYNCGIGIESESFLLPAS